MFSAESGVQIGSVETLVTSGRGLSAEEITGLIMRKILFVSDTAPPAIREQAVAFKDRIENVLLHYVKQAQASERTTICGLLNQAGESRAAEIVRKL